MIESHVTSLEISKKLKESGWTKETEFWWGIKIIGKANQHPALYSNEIAQIYINNKVGEFYPAAFATEILEELPNRMAGVGVLKIYKFPNEYEITYASIYPQKDKTLLDALAAMWLYLKQEELLK